MGETLIFENAQKTAAAAAERFVELAKKAIKDHGQFFVAFSGGSTPRPMYQLLGQKALQNRIEWNKVQVFWSDERCVPPDDDQSNYHMTRMSLLDHIPLPEENIHRIKGELDPDAAAAQYEKAIHEVFGMSQEEKHDLPVFPRFDLVMLGLGENGHTASLFPNTRALEEEKRWAVANFIPEMDSWRITFTYPLINHAAHIIFLVTGEKKAQIFHELLEGDNEQLEYPALGIEPLDGTLEWFLDKAAASPSKA
jgi:6-phosphogluconolactonase